MNKLTVHPACAAAPDMEPKAYEQFKQNIKEKGLLHPIVLHKGQILDGKHRQRACDELKIAARYNTDDKLAQSAGDPWVYVWSTMLRNNYTFAQKSWWAGEWHEQLKPEGKKQQLAHLKRGTEKAVGVIRHQRKTLTRSRDIAAEKFGVAPRMVSKVVTVIQKGCPQLQKAVKAGRVNISLGARVALGIKPTKQREVVAVAMLSEKPEEVLNKRVPVKKRAVARAVKSDPTKAKRIEKIFKTMTKREKIAYHEKQAGDEDLVELRGRKQKKAARKRSDKSIIETALEMSYDSDRMLRAIRTNHGPKAHQGWLVKVDQTMLKDMVRVLNKISKDSAALVAFFTTKIKS